MLDLQAMCYIQLHVWLERNISENYIST